MQYASQVILQEISVIQKTVEVRSQKKSQWKLHHFTRNNLPQNNHPKTETSTVTKGRFDGLDFWDDENDDDKNDDSEITRRKRRR
jgi:hypothetical protein